MLKFVKVNKPEAEIVAENLGSDYVFKNLAIAYNEAVSLCEVNANVLKEALINSPELLQMWGYELVQIKSKPKPVVKKTTTEVTKDE